MGEDENAASAAAEGSSSSCCGGGTILDSVTSTVVSRRGATMPPESSNSITGQARAGDDWKGRETDRFVKSNTTTSQTRGVPEDVVFLNSDSMRHPPSFSVARGRDADSFDGGGGGAAPQPMLATTSNVKLLSDMSTIPSEYNEAATCEDGERLSLALSFTPSMVSQRDFHGTAGGDARRRMSNNSQTSLESRDERSEGECCGSSMAAVPRVISKEKPRKETCKRCGTRTDTRVRNEGVVEKRLLSRICLSLATVVALSTAFHLVKSEFDKKQSATVALYQGKLDDQSEVIEELKRTIESLKKEAESLKQYRQKNEGLEREVRRLKTETAKAVLKSHATKHKLREESRAQCVEKERDLLAKMLETKQLVPQGSNYVYWDVLARLLGAFAQPAACYFFNACPVSNTK